MLCLSNVWTTPLLNAKWVSGVILENEFGRFLSDSKSSSVTRRRLPVWSQNNNDINLFCHFSLTHLHYLIPMNCVRRIGSCPAVPQRRLPRRTISRIRNGRTTRPLNCASVQELPPTNNSSVSLGSVIIVDNYDSFTYNLSQVRVSAVVRINCFQYLGELNCDHLVVYNDEKSVHELKKLKPRGILISPGPGRPEDSGISMQVIEELGPDLPIMGVCMGLQCMAQVFGGRIIRSPTGVMHGKTSPVHHTNEGLLRGLPK